MSVPRKKSVTAKDMANACGISQATVSYVINNKEGKKISEATRKMVFETALSFLHKLIREDVHPIHLQDIARDHLLEKYCIPLPIFSD